MKGKRHLRQAQGNIATSPENSREKKIDVEKVAKAPTVEKLGSIPHTPTLEVLAAQQDLAFCFFLSVVCDYCVVPVFCLRFAFVSERSSLSGIVWADSLWNGRAGQERSGWRRRGCGGGESVGGAAHP